MKIQSKPRFFRTVRRKNRGVTLIEVVSALGIIAIGLVGLLALFPVAIRESARAGDRTSAAILAEYVIEQLRLQQDEVNNINAGGSPEQITDEVLSDLGWKPSGYTFDAYGSGKFGSGELFANGTDTEQELFSRYEVTLAFDVVLNKGSDATLLQTIVTIRWPRAASGDAAERHKQQIRQDTMTFVTYIRPGP